MADPTAPLWLAVGRIGKPHGVRGEVTVEVLTDEPDRRFAARSRLAVHVPPRRPVGEDAPSPPSEVVVEQVRWHQGRMLLSLEAVSDREGAEALRGLVLQVAVDPGETPEDPEEFYDHQLEGLRVEDLEGTVIGEVRAVQHPGVQDLLVVRTPSGRDALVPFVAALVPEVDVAGGRVVVADRPGLVTPFED